MSDILRQVDEDLRKEKLSNLFKKYGLYVILTLVIIIGSVIGYQVMVSIDKSKKYFVNTEQGLIPATILNLS